jgi:two-component system, cell cycle response regulator
VLVVDDSATVRAVIAAALEAEGHVVLPAADGRAALELARSTPVDLVLLDVEMPEVDGWQVVSALKADPATSDVAVVFLTARASTDDAVQALRLGTVDFVRKPPRPAELLARVGAALRTKQRHDALRSQVERLEERPPDTPQGGAV